MGAGYSFNKRVAVQDETTALGLFYTFNFTGTGVTATDAGNGVVNVTIGGSTTAWLYDGNTVGSEKYIGTNDAFDFPIYSNGTRRITVKTGGFTGFRTTSPLTTVHILSDNTVTNTLDALTLGSQGTGITSSFTGIMWNCWVNNFAPNPCIHTYATFDSANDADSRFTIATRDGSGGFQDTMSLQLGKVGIGVTQPVSILQLVENTSATLRGLVMDNSFAGTSSSKYYTRKSRSGGVITTADVLGNWTSAGHDGTSYVDAANITMTSTGTIGTGIVPGQIIFRTATSVGTLTQALLIDSDQSVTFAGNAFAPNLVGGTAVGSKINYKSTTGAGTVTGIGHNFIGGTNGATTLFTINNQGDAVLTLSLTVPTHYGGTAVGSNLTYISTTGAGTAAAAAHTFAGGTNGGTVITTMLNNGNVGIGISPTYFLDVAPGTAMAGACMSIRLLANGASASSSFANIDFIVPTTGLAAQIFHTATNYSSAGSAIVANQFCIYGETAAGLSLGASSTSGVIELVTGGGLTANKRIIIGAKGTQVHTLSASTSGAVTSYSFTCPANTGQTAGTETIGYDINLGSVQHASNTNITTQRGFRIVAPTYSSANATSTITNAATFAITAAPTAGTNTAITNAYALWIQAGQSQFDGNISIGDTFNIVASGTTGSKFGTATSQKFSFWNATPIVQPTTAIAAATFVTNTSGIINDTATWDGYTIGQVVKALRNFGILA